MTMAEVLESIQGLGIRFDRHAARLKALEEEHMTSAASDQIYCFKCRSKTDTLEAQEVVLKNGRPAVTGQCAACGTKKFRMGAVRK